MKQFVAHFNGVEFYPREPRDTWPESVRKWLDENWSTYPDDWCLFLDRKCIRPQCNHLCGAILQNGDPGDFDKVPFWIVYSLWSHPVPVVETPTQQLKLFEPAAIDVKWLHYGKWPKCNRKWWVRTFYCKQGAHFAIDQEKDLGAYDVRVTKVLRKPGCKRKVITEPYLFCGR